ncbi:heme-binding domain-containing protein [Maribellus mangrovi]|uniref:heme-binding domain-containing protein n=1 Tax=Maribellus mangrovi TaxID=3133146 RepID=UPI0030EB56C0
MIKILKISGLVIVLGLVIIQFFPPEKDTTEEVPVTDFVNNFDVPEKVQHVLRDACYDCHSNNTRYPWYSKVQPVGWYLQNHINKAKEDLNFSEFGNYSDRQQNSKINGIINQVREDEMPLPAYTLMHRDARLSEEDKKAFIDYMDSIKGY